MRALILPGLDGTGKLLTDFVEALKPDIQANVAAYPPDIAMDYDDLTDLVENSLPDGKFLLIGESFSGPIAIYLAARWPKSVIGLVLCATFAKSPRPTFKRFLRLLDLPLPIPYIGLSDRFTMGRWATKDWRNRTSAAIGEVHSNVVRRRLANVLNADASTDLSTLDLPIHYLQGSADRLVPKSAWANIHEIVPHAQLAVIEGPHFLLQANPKAAATAVRAFALDITGKC